MKISPVGVAAALAVLGTAGCYSGEFGKHGSSERLKNGLVTIVTGIAAQDTYGCSKIAAKIDRPFQRDSALTGTTTEDSIDVVAHIPLKNNEFIAVKRDGTLKGIQDKLMFKWVVEQTGPTTYRIQRTLGLDGTLELTVENGTINGHFSKPVQLDYQVTGSIGPDGSYNLTLGIPFNPDWHVRGTIQKN